MDSEMIMRALAVVPSFSARKMLDKVIYVADNGQNTCAACSANAGKIFNIDDPSLPQLPIHQNCRCKYIALDNSGKDVTTLVELHRIYQTMIDTHQLSEPLANDLAGQIIKARNENANLQDQRLFLLFNGSHLISSDGKLLLDAISGKAFSSEEKIDSMPITGLVNTTTISKFDYSYERQGTANVGSLPQGLYMIECKESGSLSNGNIHKHLIKKNAWGDYHWQLIPDVNTDTRGRKRNSFTIHGGDTPGSAGCIDLSSNDTKFKKYLDSLNMQKIYVYADYSQKAVTVKQEKTKVFPVTPMQY